MQHNYIIATVFGVLLVATVVAVVRLAGGSADAAFPGVNGKIAFHSDRPGNFDVYVMNSDGSNVTNLTVSFSSDSSPNWSPDGSKILFDTDRHGQYEAYVMNANGSGQTNLSAHPSEDSFPVWSSDGSQVAFDTFRDLNLEVYVMNSDGSGQTNLTRHPADDGLADWSPDGSRIAFISDRDGISDIYTIRPDGTGILRLTSHPSGDISPSWSPDGTKIAFVSLRDEPNPTMCTICNAEIYVMNANGSGQTRLTNSPGIDWFPAWSPDGTKIAFGSERDGNMEIYVMNADGSAQTRLTFNPAFDNQPSWQPLMPTPTPTPTATNSPTPTITPTPTPQPTPTPKNPTGDTDGDTILNADDPNDDNDACTDVQELGPDEAFGGRRNPHNFWDWFDPNEDGSVTVLDFFGLLQRFGSVGDPAIDPLSEPDPPPAYHTRFDRGPAVGKHPWNAGPPDGAITVTDFFALLAQFGHTC